MNQEKLAKLQAQVRIGGKVSRHFAGCEQVLKQILLYHHSEVA